MTQAHIDFHSNPMKVKLAVETLSASTANAIEYLMKQGHSEFHGVDAMIKYIRTCDSIFNTFNSTTTSCTKDPLKQMMSVENACAIFEVFEMTRNYFKGLQCRTEKLGKLVPICHAGLKTAFQGCIVNIETLTSLYKELVEANLFSHIPVHSLSQDHLEVSLIKKSDFRQSLYSIFLISRTSLVRYDH